MLWESQLDFFLFYVVIILIHWVVVLLLNLVKNQSDRLFALLLVSIVFSFLVALRSIGVGSDSGNYASLVTDPGFLEQPIEPIFLFLADLTRKLGGNAYIYFFLISFLMNTSLIYSFFKIDRDKFVNYYLLFSTSFLFINMNMNILRQGVAIGFGTLALAYFMNKQNAKFVFFLILAILSHYSAIVLMVVIPFGFVSMTKTKLSLVLLLILALYSLKLSTIVQPLTQYSSIFERLYWYLTWDKLVPFRLKHIYILIIFMFFIYIFIKSSFIFDVKTEFALKIMVIIFLFISIFREDEFLVDRSILYFYPILAVLVYELYELFISRENRHIANYLVVLGSLVWLCQSFYQYYNWWVIGNIR